MRMVKTTKLNTFLSTLNFVLCFVGYQLATSLFLPVSSDIEGISRSVTVPYRVFALLISMLVILLNYRKKVDKTPLALKVLWVYWIALIIRIFYDTNVRTDVHLTDTTQLWFYIFGIILPAMISVMLSYRVIDFNMALRWVYIGTVVTLVLSLFNNASLLMSADEISGRSGGNLALNTITFGHLGTTGIVLSLFFLSKGGVGLIKKMLIITVMLLSFFIMLRAGSRSPILALAVIIIFWLFGRGKNIALGVSVTVLAVVLLFVFMDPILSFLGDISPIIESRLRASIYEGDSSGRDPLYIQAYQGFLDKPLLGSQFALFDSFGGFGYSHNIILDALMGLGLMGGIVMIYILWIGIKYAYKLIKRKDPNFWIGLILIQQITLSMLSGALYYNQILNVILVFIFLYIQRNLSVKRGKI